MKSLFAMLLLTMCLSFTFAQSDSTSIINGSKIEAFDSQKTFDKVYGDVKAAVLSLADSFKTTADHVYKILVKQAVINAWLLFIFLLLGIILPIIGAIFCIKNQESRADDEAKLSLGVVLCILGGVFMLVGLLGAKDIMIGFFNPEYGAIKEILNAIN